MVIEFNQLNMKKILYIFMAVALLAGCVKPGGDEKNLSEKIAGEWHCSPSNMDADIYVNFMAEGTFELYQQITVGSYRLYRGTWTADDAKKTITGKYNDGENWGSDYSVAVSEDGNSMTFTDSASIEYVYSREEIPAEVKETSVVIVKSPVLDSIL